VSPRLRSSSVQRVQHDAGGLGRRSGRRGRSCGGSRRGRRRGGLPGRRALGRRRCGKPERAQPWRSCRERGCGPFR
jgi:hypothetical protein